MLAEVTRRSRQLPEDEDFLWSLYRSTRINELRTLGWSQTELDSFMRMQYEAQSVHYAQWYPEAEYWVVVVGGQLGGRLIVERSGDWMEIVDVALLPQFRGLGVGTQIVRRLFEEADAARLAIRCQVEIGNQARRFWERLGMVTRGVDGAHIAMERACVISPQ